jgi:hypothetical protein
MSDPSLSNSARTAAGETADILAAALWYSEDFRWRVFPVHSVRDDKCTCGDPECISPGKHPRTQHGCKDASVDPAVIRAWWKKWPDANVALATGKPSGVDVLDVDCRHFGNETLWELERRHGELPATVMSITGSLGTHLYFRHVDGIKNSVSGIGEGLDLRTTGGLVVLPPSLHKNGRRYIWEGASRPNEIAVAPFPEWLRELARGRANGNGKRAAAPDVPAKIPQGKRHATLLSFGGSMRRRGAGEEELMAALSTMNSLRCEKPLAEADVRKVAHSLCTYAPDPLANVFNMNGGAAEAADEPATAPARFVPDPAQDLGPSRAGQPARPVAPRVLTAADVLKLVIPAPDTLFEGFPVPRYGVSLIVGSPKSGKTILAVQEALSIASGAPLFENYRVKHQGAVLLVEQDDPGGAGSIKAILEKRAGAKDIPFYLVERVPFTFGAALEEWLAKQIEALKLEAIILDSYTALRGSRRQGGDIVKAEQNDLMLLDELSKRKHCGIQIVHHASKGSAALGWDANAAGSFAMTAASEAQIHVSRFRDLDGAAAERLVRIRGRHAEDAEMVLRFQKETLDYTHVIEGAAAELYPLLLQIHSALGFTVFAPKQLMDATGVSRATANRHIDRLYRAGILKKHGHGQYELMDGIFPRNP